MKSGGLHEKHAVATWNLGNHLNIGFYTQGNKEKCVFGGRSQDLPNTDFQPAIRQRKYETPSNTRPSFIRFCSTFVILLFIFVYSVLRSSVANLMLNAAQGEFAKANFVLRHDVGSTPWCVVPGLRSAVSLPTLFHVV